MLDNMLPSNWIYFRFLFFQLYFQKVDLFPNLNHLLFIQFQFFFSCIKFILEFESNLEFDLHSIFIDLQL